MNSNNNPNNNNNDNDNDSNNDKKLATGLDLFDDISLLAHVNVISYAVMDQAFINISQIFENLCLTDSPNVIYIITCVHMDFVAFCQIISSKAFVEMLHIQFKFLKR